MDQAAARWICLTLSFLFIVEAQVNNHNTSSLINVTFIEDAVAKGAVCLDGSPGAYFFDRGFGNGVNNWIIYLQGGGWCDSERGCLDRSRIELGSTKNASVKYFGTILGANQDTNPDFYNWNRVYILYCDGASFMADIEAVDPKTKLHLRGRRIFSSIMEELLATKGMNSASNALLVGNSAGGLATILNCDRFRSYLPNAGRVKCLSDSGFFIRAKDLPGALNRENYNANIVAFHGLARFLPKACTSITEPSLCLFPENVVGDVETPLFLLNSDLDKYQILYNLIPNPPDRQGWKNCTDEFKNIQKCNANQLLLIKDFQTAFVKTLKGLNYNPSRGLFINSCFIHDFVYRQGNWQGTPTLQNKTVEQAFSDWYFERSSVQLIDTQHTYPINCSA